MSQKCAKGYKFIDIEHFLGIGISKVGSTNLRLHVNKYKRSVLTASHSLHHCHTWFSFLLLLFSFLNLTKMQFRKLQLPASQTGVDFGLELVDCDLENLTGESLD
jgi:hypothetical protein